MALAGCSAERQIERARYLATHDQPEEAIRILHRQLPKINDPKQLCEGYVVLGDALVGLGRVPDAFNAYEKAMRTEPSATAPQKKTAELLIATGSGEKAIILTESLARAYPVDVQVLGLHAAALAASGDMSGAESVYRRAAALRPSDADIAVSLAELLLRQDRDDEAREVLLHATDSTKSPAVWMALGRLDEQQGNPIGAEVAYRRAVSVEDSPATNFRLAQFLQRAAKINEAQAVLKHLDELNGNAHAAADLSFSLGRTSAALTDYLKALHSPARVKSDDQEAITSRAVEAALYDRGKSEQERVRTARVILNQNAATLNEGTRAVLETETALVGNDLAMATAWSERALASMPQSPSALYLRGVVLDRQANAAGAIDAWQRAVDLGDHIPSRLLLAQAALRRADLDTAQEHAAAVVREEPANLQALLVYARVLEREQNLDAAEAIVNRALTVDPSSVEGNVIAGNIAMQRNANGAAFVAYEKALLFDGRSAEGIAGLLKVFSQAKPTRASISKIERMAEAPPASAMLYEVAGRMYEMAGMKPDAQRALRRSLELDAHRPTAELALWRTGNRETVAMVDPRAHVVRDDEHVVAMGDQTGVTANNLAFAYASRGVRLDRALELSLDAVHRMPSKPEPMDTLGFVFLKMRQYTAAADAFERALQLAPEPPAKRQILLHLADAYTACGQEDKAASARAQADRLRG
jgi:tetratricopeptide (TPR) repeat protein